jgi:hypothetical protein
MLFDIRGGSYGRTVTENGKKVKLPGIWAVINNLAEIVGDSKAATANRLDEFRIENDLNGYIGEPPANDFDKMLESWYDLIDKYSDKLEAKDQLGNLLGFKGNLDLDKWVPEAEKFIAGLTPELQQGLAEWRSRKETAPAVQEILDLRQPNEELWGLDEKTGEPDTPDRKELWKGVLAILKQELGIGERELLFIWEEGATDPLPPALFKSKPTDPLPPALFKSKPTDPLPPALFKSKPTEVFAEFLKKQPVPVK